MSNVLTKFFSQMCLFFITRQGGSNIFLLWSGKLRKKFGQDVAHWQHSSPIQMFHSSLIRDSLRAPNIPNSQAVANQLLVFPLLRIFLILHRFHWLKCCKSSNWRPGTYKTFQLCPPRPNGATGAPGSNRSPVANGGTSQTSSSPMNWCWDNWSSRANWLNRTEVATGAPRLNVVKGSTSPAGAQRPTAPVGCFGSCWKPKR